MGRSPCCEKDGLKKGPWTPEEDQKLIDYIQKHGYGNWRTLPKNAGLQRCGKSCRLRWTNYLRPDIKRGRFSFEEEESIIQLHSILGNKWSAIAARLPGRTDNEIKNYWNTHIRKRLLRMGIDPVTHSPRLDLLDLSSILNSSLYNHNSSHQMNNLSRLLGVQHLVNPELLKLANSLLSSQRENNSYIFQQNNFQENQILNPQLQNDQIPPLSQFTNFQTLVDHQEIIPTILNSNCVPFSGDAQIIQPNVENFSSNLNNFSTQNEWENNGMASNFIENQCYVNVPSQDFNYYHHQNHLPDSSTFDHHQSNNFSFQSVLSTPSSSNYVTSSSTTTEDERESYCSNYMLKFEIPDNILDVNEFM